MRDRQPAEEQPTFTGDLLGGTIDCTPTGWISIDPFRDVNQEQWVATLSTGVDHDPTLAIWGVTVRDRPAEPVACFLAPVGASPRRLTAHAAAALSAVPRPRQPIRRRDAVVIGACVLGVAAIAAVVAVLFGHDVSHFDVTPI